LRRRRDSVVHEPEFAFSHCLRTNRV
jgi:hypothetical protein